FEGRAHPLERTNWLASPRLVVGWALAGNVPLDLTKKPLGTDQDDTRVSLNDHRPSQGEIVEAVEKVKTDMYRKEDGEDFEGDDIWKSIKVPESKVYEWSNKSTYIQHPPFFDGMGEQPEPVQNIKDARILALLGDSVTTDHISPA